MKGLALLSLAAMLLLSAGCAARPDWIQATLVTADVTGTWRGASSTPGHPVTLTLVLKQRGSKVTGTAQLTGRDSAGLGSHSFLLLSSGEPPPVRVDSKTASRGVGG